MSDVDEKIISNSIDQLSELVTWLNNWLESHEVSDSVAFKMRFAMEEITTNAVYYSYPPGTSGTVKVRLFNDITNACYRLDILDDGEPFNPLDSAPEVDPDLTLDEREVGGLGVFLVKNLSEDCVYQRLEGWNHLSIGIHD